MSKSKTKTSVYITNLGKYNEGRLVGEWLPLPCTKAELQSALVRIGIDDYYEEYFITDFDSTIEHLRIEEYDNILEISALLEKIEALDEHDKLKLNAMLEVKYCTPREALENVDKATLIEDIKNEYELGEYFFTEYYKDQIPESLQSFFDFQAFGRDIDINSNGSLTSYGFLEVD